jgi:hypothetical protein
MASGARESCSGELSEIADSKPKAKELAWQMAHDALRARRRRLRREAMAA